jgi:hypothetical protein
MSGPPPPGQAAHGRVYTAVNVLLADGMEQAPPATAGGACAASPAGQPSVIPVRGS